MMSSNPQQQQHCTVVVSLTNEGVFLLLKKPGGAQQITDDIMTGSITGKSFLVLFGVNVCVMDWKQIASITIGTSDA